MSELIGGLEAINKKESGESVQWSLHGLAWSELTDSELMGWQVERFLNKSLGYQFRLKPRTVKLEIEVPEPFKPKDGEDFFVIEPSKSCGFLKGKYREDSVFCKKLIQFGAWRTEDEIKIVVEQLRKLGALR